MLKSYFKSSIIALVIIFTFIASTQAKPKIESYIIRSELEEINKSTLEEVQNIDPVYQRDLVRDTFQIPEKSYLQVPFICQAPLQTEENWKLHEESCEEAAVLQAYLYETNSSKTKEEANQTILEMIKWQEEEENFGEHKDLYAEDLKTFITGYYNLEEDEVTIIKNAEIEDIKEQIALGHPVIAPITGEILQNPYYPYPGYHMLTVTGYTKDRIITNDNGTRRGEDFSYDQEIFERAFKDAGGEIIIFNLNSN